ncbi:MAG: MotA/TolQ/ExbB proton channel family protein, partial [Clostridia bacterium]|nr:MotA/TolQ/ExbB proton channel family protein [Clostridia bacterium]
MAFLQGIADNAVDILVYIAMGLVFLAGFLKCILPVQRSARGLRHAVRMLEKPTSSGDRPVWQDSLFLGKRMQDTWKRFLRNAEQLDARGLACDVEDYVNDDTVIYAFGHVQMAEMLPGLLTSLGILGTFIGLIRGLGGLDVSDAAKTMESIPKMIGGMTFAFTTSIVGVACSIVFNIFNRIALGRADASMNDFYSAFHDLVMPPPLEDSVTMICQQEDQEKILRKASSEMTAKVSEGITQAVEHSFVPVTQAMNRFIMGQTQTQVEGLSNITQQFIAQMNRSLSGQFV